LKTHRVVMLVLVLIALAIGLFGGFRDKWIEMKINDNTSAVNELGGRLRTGEAAIETNRGEIESNRGAIESNRTDVGQAQQDIDANRSSISEVETAVDTNREAVGKIEGRIESERTNLQVALDRLAEIDQRNQTDASHRQEVAAATGKLREDLQAALDTLEKLRSDAAGDHAEVLRLEARIEALEAQRAIDEARMKRIEEVLRIRPDS